MQAKILALAAASAVAVVVVITGISVLSRDEAQRRYDAMAVGIEDHCRLYTSGSRCRDFSDCYRAGIEEAFPRDVLVAVIENKIGPDQVPDSVEQAVRQLERDCGTRVGIAIQG